MKLDIKSKRMLRTLAEALYNEDPTRVVRNESPLSSGEKVSFSGRELTVEFRRRDGMGIEMFGRGPGTKDLGLKFYQSSGDAGRPETVEQAFEIVRRLFDVKQ